MSQRTQGRGIRLIAGLLAFLFVFQPIELVFAEEVTPIEAGASVPNSQGDDSLGEGSSLQDSLIVNPARESSLPPVDPSTGRFLEEESESSESANESTEELSEEGDPESSSSLTGVDGDISSPSIAPALEQKLNNIDKNSGAYVYDFPITVPPGRNGLQPDVKLQYNSQNTEDTNVMGYGWSIDIPYIERINKKGTDQLYSQNYFYSSLTGELIDLGSGSYGSKTDNGEFLNYSLSSNVWTVKDKKGVVYKFGTNAAERQDDPNDSSRIFKWMLQEVRDANDNYIKYTYYKDAGQIYPSTITYTGNGSTDGIFVVNFVRSSRSDNIKSYKTAFSVVSDYRITEINTTVSGTWYRKYTLAYTTGANGLRSMLSSITESGRDESLNTTTLPAVSFTYQSSTAGWDEDTSTFTAPEAMTSWRNILDLNNDGLIDIFKSYEEPASTTNKKAYLNNGNYTWSNNTGLEAPILFQKRETRQCSFSDVFDQGVRVFDFNGDQYPDIVKAGDRVGTTSLYDAYTNSGTAWTQNTNWNPIIGFTELPNPGCQFGTINTEDYSTRVLDLNGDGLPDITRQEGNYYGTQLNTGTGFASVVQTWNMPVDIDMPFAQPVDVNNDGLPDIMYSQRSNFYQSWFEYAYLNTGTGSWTNDTSLITPIHFTNIPCCTDRGARFLDVNGDGFSDVVVDPQTTDDTRLGRGNGWAAANSNWNLPVPAGSIFGGTAHVGDFNEDGLVDFMYVAQSNPLNTRVWIHRGVQPDLLSRVTYATGGYTDMTYQKTAKYRDGSNNLLSPNLPFNLTTVKTITHNDGSGLTEAYTYSYEGGKYFYNNALDRRLSGFAKIKQTDAAGNVITFYFHQGDTTDSTNGEYSDEQWKIGKVYRIEVANSSSNIYQRVVNKWDSYDLNNGRKFVKLARSLDMTYDGDSTHKDKVVEYTYSNTNGNLTQKVEYGVVTGSTDGTFTDSGTDDFTTAISYVSTTTPNLVGLPSQITITDHNAAKVKESKYYYDTQSLGTAAKGNLTKREDWKVSTTYVNIQKTYNSTYGTVASEIDQRSKTTTYTNDTYNLYPAIVTNPLSQATSFTYDYTSGKVTQKTDPNSRVFQWTYDGLDRLTAEKQPDLSSPSTLVTKTSYIYTNTSGAVSVQKTDNLDGSIARETYLYFDGLNRPIQQRVEAEGTNYQVVDKVYNNRGLLDKESLPYFSTGTSKTTATSTTSLYTSYSYDAVGRVTSLVNNVGTTSNAYSDWKLTVTDPRSKTKALYKDAYNNLSQVDETNSASTYSTYYEYGYGGNLTKITDALGNIRNFTYDGLGRRLTAQDLHASADVTFGTWTYTYDDAGNITSTVDPKSQTINYTYDDTNRQLTEDYTGAGGTEVTYTYDSGTDGIGRLTGIATSSLSQTNTYNALGLVASESKTINSTAYATSYTYDRQGTQVTITNPDSSQVKYLYNSAGLLDSVQRKESTDGSFINVVSNFDYSPMEQFTTVTYSNGMSTVNTYDATKLYRLSTKVTTIASSVKGQDLTYTYDNNGNITQIVDASGTSSSKTVAYVYDDLNRLTSATATGVASGQSTYTHTYTYNAIGNILTRSDGAGTYTYAGNTGSRTENPHAVTSIGAVNLTYDANGNVLTKGSSYTNTWNYRNEITQTVAGANTVTFKYDPSGQRLTYTKGAVTTVYPSKFYNYDGTNRHKHIFANGVEVATITGTGASAVVHSTATDHLTGSNIVTNSSDVQEELLDYYPYGTIRIDSKAGSYGDQRKYAGSEYDVDSGLNYMNARYYDAAIGRFVSQDPVFWNFSQLQVQLADPQSWNSYAYARNNPLVNIDPAGEFSVKAHLSYWSGVAQTAADLLRSPLGSKLGVTANPQTNHFVSNLQADSLSDFSTLLNPESGGKDRLVAGIWLGLNVVPESKVAGPMENALKSSLKGTANPVIKEAVEYGKQQHKLMDYGPGVLKEQKLGNFRVDGIDKVTKTIYELKPNTEQSINRGLKQLGKYVNTANAMLGDGYKGVLKTYESLTKKLK